MKLTNSKITENRQKKPKRHTQYRASQVKKGLVRIEFQTDLETKEHFEQSVKIVAEEYNELWDERKRLAKAKTQLFKEQVKQTYHDLSILKKKFEKQIDSLKTEIKTLSPSFFITDIAKKTPLPEAINALSDDPAELKQLLTQFHLEIQELKLSCDEYKQQADQFEKLYVAFYNANEDLTNELKLKTL